MGANDLKWRHHWSRPEEGLPEDGEYVLVYLEKETERRARFIRTYEVCRYDKCGFETPARSHVIAWYRFPRYKTGGREKLPRRTMAGDSGLMPGMTGESVGAI